jgi:hypothetical protein
MRGFLKRIPFSGAATESRRAGSPTLMAMFTGAIDIRIEVDVVNAFVNRASEGILAFAPSA